MSKSNTNLTGGQLDAKKKMNKKKRKKIIKIILILLIIAAVILFALNKLGITGKNNTDGEQKLTTYTVSQRSITQVLTSSGTIEPNDQYTITALVNGEIIADHFEEGDTVIEDQLLYEIDSDNLDSSVTRAENSLKNANKALNDALESLENLNVESDFSGVVKKMYVEIGDEINTGTLIADVVDNRTMCIDIPFMEVDAKNISVGDIAVVTFDNFEEKNGTVTEISPVTNVNSLGVTVRNITISVKNTGSITTSSSAYANIGDAYCTESAVFYNNDEGKVYSKASGEVTRIYFDEGDYIEETDTIIRLESDDLEDQIEKLRDSVDEAEDSLEDAHDAYDNYNITAPITGKVISKSHKSGDTLSSGQNSSSTLAVIYDMSALKFNMSIDELDIDKLNEGQDVIITCDSRDGEEYHGTITNISIQGTTTSGTTVYPVEVTIENTEDIDQRTIADDGTVNKVYRTGMTSTENTYSLISSQATNDGVLYTYSDTVKILRKADGSLYDGEKQLKAYLGGTYTQGSSFYSLSGDFSSLTLEVQNDKKMLRPGMNIDAEIIVENRENVIAVPLAAVGRGNVVKVLKNTANSNSEADESDTERNNEQNSESLTPALDKGAKGTMPENMGGEMPEGMPERSEGFDKENMPQNLPEGFDMENMPEDFTPDMQAGRTGKRGTGESGYGTADLDAEYDQVTVTVGISDDDYVEITSGLNVGDIVIVDTQNLASGSENMQFGMMGGGMMGGGMMGGGMMGGGMPGGMGGGPIGR